MFTVKVTGSRCGIAFAPERKSFTAGSWHTCSEYLVDPGASVSGDMREHSGAVGVEFLLQAGHAETETEP